MVLIRTKQNMHDLLFAWINCIALDVPGYCQLRATSCMPQVHMGMGL